MALPGATIPFVQCRGSRPGAERAMKIAQYIDQHRIRIGLIEAGTLKPIDFDGDMIDFIKSGNDPETINKPIPLDHIKMAPPVSNPSKIIAIALNYRDHADESKGVIPEVPLLFAKFPTSIIGHGDQIVWDMNVTKKVDFEAELAVIMGKEVYQCAETEALGFVFGYTCANDVSARDLQFGDKQWVRGKSLDTFCPIGPWITTNDEIPDPHSLRIQCWLNDNLMQNSNTSLMIFSIPKLVSFLSTHFTLLPGDIILTGTPSGVGVFRNPSVYMKDGDEVVVEIERLGRLVNHCRTA
jgi:2-keto-4-pentenoate hydratase/2-oxohepta-3-ene-1,7-dioic acid hydratase in catechol pathway